MFLLKDIFLNVFSFSLHSLLYTAKHHASCRYHEGEMHSGTLIVARNAISDFTYTGTFFHNDFHGIGSIITQSGIIYQGQFDHGQFHGLGKLRTLHDDDVDRGDGKKSESVYTGDFRDG